MARLPVIEAPRPSPRDGRLAQQLRDLRARRGLMQGELAALLGITPTSISRYESGRYTPARPGSDRLLSLALYGLELRLEAEGGELPDNDPAQLAEEMRAIRARHGLSQNALALALDLQPQSVSRYERMTSGTKHARLLRLALIGLEGERASAS